MTWLCCWSERPFSWHDTRKQDLIGPIITGHETNESGKDEGPSVETGTGNKSPNPGRRRDK